MFVPMFLQLTEMCLQDSQIWLCLLSSLDPTRAWLRDEAFKASPTTAPCHRSHFFALTAHRLFLLSLWVSFPHLESTSLCAFKTVCVCLSPFWLTFSLCFVGKPCATGNSGTQLAAMGVPGCPLGTPWPWSQGSHTGRWCWCHIPWGIGPGEGKREVRGYNTDIKNHSPHFSHWKLSLGLVTLFVFPSLGSFPLFRCTFFFPKGPDKYFDHI